jgi:hypothetical protein
VRGGYYHPILWLIPLIQLSAVAALLALLFFGCAPDRNKAGHIYDTTFGSVYCAGVVEWACGAELYDCHDGHKYYCLTNVRERGE